MSKENENTVDVNTDDLDAFNDLFEGKATEAPTEEPVNDEADDTEVDEQPETDEVDEESQSDADDDTADENSSATDEGDDVEEEAAEETPKPAPNKKKSAQERINELTAARREAEREADKWRVIAEERANKGSSESSEEKGSEPEPEVTAPDPDDKKKYPLGDLDPKYNQDMLDFKLNERLAELETTREKQMQEQAEAQRASAMQEEWNAKLEGAKATYGDFDEKTQTLVEPFEGINPEMGQFIAETIMSMEKGPDVLYHLADNPSIAEQLARSSPVNAAMALAKMEATFETAPRTKAPTHKSSKAPVPPKSMNRGNSPRFAVAPDTDDLDAFSDVFFDKKK